MFGYAAEILGIPARPEAAGSDGERARHPAIEWARSVGVTGIPTFVFNEKYAVVGAQEYPAFQGVMAKLAEEARAEAEPPAGEG